VVTTVLDEPVPRVYVKVTSVVTAPTLVTVAVAEPVERITLLIEELLATAPTSEVVEDNGYGGFADPTFPYPVETLATPAGRMDVDDDNGNGAEPE